MKKLITAHTAMPSRSWLMSATPAPSLVIARRALAR